MEQNIIYQQELESKRFDYPADVTNNNDQMEIRWQQFQQQEQQKLALLPDYYQNVRKSYNYLNDPLVYGTPAEREQRRRRKFQKCIFYILFYTVLLCLGIIQLSCGCVWQQQQTN